MLRGEVGFHYRPDRIAGPPTKKRRSHAGELAAELTAGQSDLLAKLKDLRLRLAKERGVPAYVIFPDRALIDMAQRCPRSHSEFAAVNGVGAAKLRDFADLFLSEIAKAS